MKTFSIFGGVVAWVILLFVVSVATAQDTEIEESWMTGNVDIHLQLKDNNTSDRIKLFGKATTLPPWGGDPIVVPGRALLDSSAIVNNFSMHSFIPALSWNVETDANGDDFHICEYEKIDLDSDPVVVETGWIVTDLQTEESELHDTEPVIE